MATIASPKLAVTYQDYQRSTGGSLAPSYAKSFGGLDELYRNFQPAPAAPAPALPAQPGSRSANDPTRIMETLARQNRNNPRLQMAAAAAFQHQQDQQESMDYSTNRDQTHRQWTLQDLQRSNTREDQQRNDDITRRERERQEQRQWMTADQLEAYQRQDATRDEERTYRTEQEEAERARKRAMGFQLTPHGATGYGTIQSDDGDIIAPLVPLQRPTPAARNAQHVDLPDPDYQIGPGMTEDMRPKIKHRVEYDENGAPHYVPIRSQGSPAAAPSAPAKPGWKSRIPAPTK